jgi:hypothetical protein
MRIIAALHSAEAIRKILECLGLPSRDKKKKRYQAHGDGGIIPRSTTSSEQGVSPCT